MSNGYLRDADALWPLIEPKVRKIVTAVGQASGASSGGGGVSEHDLGGSLHKGVLRDDQGPQFLLANGSRPLTGNLLVSAGVTIDGVDLSAHAADPDAHHARLHGILSTSDHSVTGSLFQVVGLAGTNTLGLLTPSADVRTGAAESLLKSNAAGELGVKGLAVGSAMILSGNGNVGAFPDIQFTGDALLAAEGSLYVSLDSDNNAASGAALIVGHNSPTTVGFVELFRFSDAGTLRITAAAPTISTAANDLTIAPANRTLFADDKQIRSQTHTAGFLGAGFSISWPLTGKAHLDIRSAYMEELEVTAFQADIMRVRVGEDFLGQGMGTTSAAFVTPAIGASVRVTFENNPTIAGQIFMPDEWVMLQVIQRGTGLLAKQIWGQVSGYIDEGNDQQSWLFTMRSGPVGLRVNKASNALAFGFSGSGYIHHNVLRSANGPWTRYATWSGANPYTPANRRVHTQAGNLNGLVDISTNRYGIAAGNNLGLTPATGFSGFTVDDTGGLRLFSTAIALYSGAVVTVDIQPTGNVKLGTNIANAINTTFEFVAATGALRVGPGANAPTLNWTGTTLALRNSAGTDVILLDSSGASYFAGVMTIGSAGEIRQGTGTLGSNYTGLRLWRDGSIGRIGGYKSNVLQWYGDTLGELRAGTGLLALADDGLGLARYQTSFGVPIAGTESRAAVAWWDNIDSRTGAPLARIYASRSDAGSGAYPTLSIEVDPANANANLRPSLWLIGNRAGFAPTLWLGNIYNVVGLPGIYPSRDATTLADTVQFSGSLYFEAHLLRDPANADLDVGTAGNPFRTIYASQVIATTISGASMAGQTWTYPGSMVIDAKAAGAQTVSIVNTFAGGTADLSVEGNITLGGTVDTVDVAAFKTAYDSHIVAYAGHIGNANAHHAQVHGITSANHTVTGAYLQLVGLTGTDTLGLITPSSDPGAAPAILRTNSLGYLTLQMLALRGNVLCSLGGLALRNGDDSAYQSLTLSGLYSESNIYFSAFPARFVNLTNGAQSAYVGGLLVSSSYASTYTANVPAQGIYSVGAVRGDSSATFEGNVTGVGIIGQWVNNTIGYWYTPAEWHTFRDITTGNFKPVAMSKLLVSNDSGHFGRVPDKGIYSLGAIRGDVKLSTPLIDTITGNLTIQPAGDLVLDPVGGEVFVASAATLRASTWTPGVLGTGWGIQDRAGQAGKAHLDIRSIYTDELIATTFTADQVRVRSGSDWLGEALAIAARDNSDLKVTIPAVGSSVRIFVENAPEVAGRIFDENEYVLIKTINRSSGLVIRETWGQVSGYIAESGARQSYLWTTRSGGSGFVLEPGTALTGFGVSGGSYIFRTVVETGRGPYERFATWSGNPYTSANRISRVEVGDLRKVIGDATTRYGIAGGNNLALTPATGFSGFSSDSVYGFRLFNSELELYSGTARKIWMSKDAGLYFRSQVGGFDGRSLRWTHDLSTNTPEDAAVVFVSGDGITSTLNINAYRAGYSVSDLILRSVSGTTTLDAYVRLSANATSSVFQVISQDGAVFRAGSGGGFEFYRDGGTTPPFTVGSYQVWHAGNFSPSAYAPLSGAAFTGAISVTGTFTASSSIVGSSLTSTTGYVASDNTIRLTNATGSAYQNIIAAGISASYINNDNGYWYTPAEWHTFRDITTGNFKPVAMSKLLVSNDSGHFGRAPANGIYSLGGIAIATSDGLTSGYSLDVAGAARFRGSIAANAHFNLSPIAEPATSASTGILWMGTDNKLYFKKPSGTAIVVAG